MSAPFPFPYPADYSTIQCPLFRDPDAGFAIVRVVKRGRRVLVEHASSLFRW